MNLADWNWISKGSSPANLDRLPDYQNVAVDVDRLLTFQAALSYTDVRNHWGTWTTKRAASGRSWRRHSEWKGRRCRVLRFIRSRIRAAHRPLVVVVPWRGGVLSGSRDDPFANFYFGGFGNNYVDHADEKRYRKYYSFPGFELNEVPGRNFLRGTIEWNLPPWRFRRMGTPGFYPTWARPAIFVRPRTNADESCAAPHDHERRRAGRLPVRRALPPRARALGRLRRGLGGRPV